MTSLLGIDIGGTFTDFLLIEDNRLRVYKRPSTPDDPARAVLDGLAEMSARPDQVVHGSTIATNAIIERKGARTALITNRGFCDVLALPAAALGLLAATSSTALPERALSHPPRGSSRSGPETASPSRPQAAVAGAPRPPRNAIESARHSQHRRELVSKLCH